MGSKLFCLLQSFTFFLNILIIIALRLNLHYRSILFATSTTEDKPYLPNVVIFDIIRCSLCLWRLLYLCQRYLPSLSNVGQAWANSLCFLGCFEKDSAEPHISISTSISTSLWGIPFEITESSKWLIHLNNPLFPQHSSFMHHSFLILSSYCTVEQSGSIVFYNNFSRTTLFKKTSTQKMPLS